MIEAVDLTEGILLDRFTPARAWQGEFKAGQNIVFIHTGGAQVLTSYRDLFGKRGNWPVRTRCFRADEYRYGKGCRCFDYHCLLTAS